MIELVAFDADDTLWHNEDTYIEAAEKLGRLLSTHYGLSGFDGKLYKKEIYKTEMENIYLLGFGVKSLTISMVETAVRLTSGRIKGEHILEITGFGKEMLQSDVRLMPGARSVLESLSTAYPLILITKGERFEQEPKIRRSGLAGFFKHIEVVSEKTSNTYARILDKYGIDPGSFVMVGNAMRSDIVPVVQLGATAIYVPHELTWEHENKLDEPVNPDSYIQIDSLTEVPTILDSLV